MKEINRHGSFIYHFSFFSIQGELAGERGLVPSNFLEEYPETEHERRDRERSERDRERLDRDRLDRDRREDHLHYNSPTHSRSSLKSQDPDRSPRHGQDRHQV